MGNNSRKGGDMKYLVITHEEELHRYCYTVEANSPEEAEERVRSGGLDYDSTKLVSAEYTSIEVEEVKG